MKYIKNMVKKATTPEYLINNSSELPSKSLKRADKFISLISFGSNEIVRIIRDLDPNKAHGHGMVSIRQLKICGTQFHIL